MNYQLAAGDGEWAEGIFEKLNVKLKAECSRLGDIIPYIPRDGHYHDLDTSEGIYWWTNGFWTGILWQMYHATKDETYRKTAETIEKRLDKALEGWEGLHHDVGFMWLHSAVANYRLTGSLDSRRRGLHAANLLAGRYNPAGKFIRAWNGDRTGWIIIDCLMNIPLLYWASAEMNDPRFSYIAQNHADTALGALVRPDGSCNHIAVLSPETGECLETPGGQGYASGSSWSRGQSWAVYGFALSFRHTRQQKYLDAAKRIAHYVTANYARNKWIPVVDFRAPPEPVKHDSTAAMISACGLLEIASCVDESEKMFYHESAGNLLKSGEKAFADWDVQTDGIIGSGTGSYHGGPGDTEVPIIYGDYFFVEAVLRLLGKDFLIW
ncbi:MAG: glycoside hydrolase family 88 protein [Treponema sp.]|jgi:unsaturated chondroitin disaccharide hydrolase|nr:glycoside hydrolase family 88 protein [Treponema sp.]